MIKYISHASFIAKVGALLLVLILGSYAKPMASTKPQVSISNTNKRLVKATEAIDANTLIRTVSYQANQQPLMVLRKN